MFSQLFGKYLTEKGVISEAEYTDLIKKQLDTRVKLGTIAVAEGLLTEEQCETLNRLQLQFDKRFGDLAVENNMLTDDQVSLLLKKQGNPYMKFLEVILESGKVSVSKVDEYLNDFKAEKGFADAEMAALKNDDIEALLPTYVFSSKKYVADITGIVVRNINRFVSRDFYFGRIARAEAVDYKYLAVQKTTGDDTVYIGIAQTDDGKGFAEVASNFSGAEAESGSFDAFDAVCEFINCNSGLFASETSKKGINLDMDPSLAYENDKITGNLYTVPVFVNNSEIKLIISVNDEVNLGAAPIDLNSGEKASVSDNVAGSNSILIVDDSRTSRKILRGLLEANGYTVVGEAQDGEEAVAMYDSLKPQLVTMDITMPKLDGIGALKEIMAKDSSAKVVMITAAGQQSKVVEALKSGAKQFVTKPFDKDEVLKSIKESM